MRNRQLTRAPLSQGTFEPRIVAFFCNWCTYLAADLAGTSRMKYAPNVRVIRLMCSGRVDPQFVLDALARGADGVSTDLHRITVVGGFQQGPRRWIGPPRGAAFRRMDKVGKTG